MLVAPTKVYVCSGLCTFNHSLRFSINTTTYHHFNPEINTLFKSAVGFVESYDVMSIILTRIGEDGAEGSLILSKSRATCLAESEQSAIVFGMPKRTIELCENIKIKNIKEVEYVRNF